MSEAVCVPSLGIDFTSRRPRSDTTNIPYLDYLNMFTELKRTTPPQGRSSDKIGEDEGRAAQNFSSLRSTASMRGLLAAENGDAMVQLDVTGSGFKTGARILAEDIQSEISLTPLRTDYVVSEDTSLARHGTLLTAGGSEGHHSVELKSILGNSNARLKSGAIVVPNSTRTSQGDKTTLEQAKPRARVEVDIITDSKTFVEGGHLRGHVKIRIRKRTTKESVVLIADGKIRVVGFECINGHDDRHTFYLASALLSDVSKYHTVMCASPPDDEGFFQAKEGVYVLPFSMELPLNGGSGKPKGVLRSHSAFTVRYIAMFSIKVKERESGKRSISHFYRDCEIWPRLNPSVVLAPASSPIRNTVTKGLFMGGNGKITLSATLHRLHWVAGQQCYVNAHVTNYTKKTIKSLTISLSRSTVLFRPRAGLNVDEYRGDSDPDACQTSTNEKQVAESTLQMGQRGARGHASAKGWWSGVLPGETQEFTHFLLLPPDALTMPRGRLLEVEYELHVSVAAGRLGSDVSVSLPLKIINFLSIDPPPTYRATTCDDNVPSQYDTTRSSEAYMIGSMLQSLEEEENEEEESELYSKSIAEVSGEESDANTNAGDPYDGYESERREDHEGLGNVSISDDSDEVVQHAISSARIDARYGEQANLFADLFYASYPDGPNDARGTDCSEDEKMERTPRPPAVATVFAHRPPGSSSFAQRVQDKMRAAGQESSLTRLNTDPNSNRLLSNDAVPLKESRCEYPVCHDSYFLPRHQILDSVEHIETPAITLVVEKTASSSAASSASLCTCGFSRGSSRSSRTSNGSAHNDDHEQSAAITKPAVPTGELSLPQPPHLPHAIVYAPLSTATCTPLPELASVPPSAVPFVYERLPQYTRDNLAFVSDTTSKIKQLLDSRLPVAYTGPNATALHLAPHMIAQFPVVSPSAKNAGEISPLDGHFPLEPEVTVPKMTAAPSSVKEKIRQLEEKAQAAVIHQSTRI